MAHWRINWENFLNMYALLDAMGKPLENRVFLYICILYKFPKEANFV